MRDCPGMDNAGTNSFLSLNAASDEVLATASVVALNAEGGLPDTIQLLPSGPKISGVDGRAWMLRDPQIVVSAFEGRGLQLPIDYNHAQFLRAPKGEDSPAAGWIEGLDVRDGAVWGRVSWTASGAAALNAREYRYVSPALRHDASGNVVEIVGAGLVNSPNFKMPALNAAAHEELSMDKDVLKKLGLPDTATAAEVLAAIERLQTSVNASQSAPSLAAFVPRADYDLALNRATTAETALNTEKAEQHQVRVTTVIEGAIKAGKIAPASKDFYLSTCSSAEGLANFEAFVAAAPSAFQTSGLEKKDPSAKGDGVSLNSEQADAAKALNIKPVDFAAFLAAQEAR